MITWLLATAWAAEVEGRVLQRGDARPLADVEVLREAEVVATTGPDGRFTVDLPEGPAVLTLRSLEHQPAEIALTVPLEAPLRVFLRPTATPGEIVVQAFRPTSDMTRHLVDAEQAYETPGTYDDAVRLVQALPGVNIQREYAPSSGDVSVRGSQPGDNRYYLDGIEVPYLYHFNQYASVFPASQLDHLELFSSGFGARYGDSVGAIVEAESDTTRPEDVTGSASLNFVTVGADVKAPLPKGWWVGVGGRRSFQDLVESPTAQYTLWPRFYDLNVRAEHTAAGGAHTGIFFLGAGDRYDRAVGELDVLDPTEVEGAPRLSYGRDFQFLGVRHAFGLGRVVTGVLHDHLRASVDAGGRQDVRTLSLPTRVDLDGRANDTVSWRAGAELRPEVQWADVEDAGRFAGLVTTEAPAAAWGVDLDARALRARLAAYGEVGLRLGPVRLMPGLRVGLDSSGWVPTVEPRLAARVRVADQTELRLGGGRYQQRPDTTRLLADPTLPTTTAWEGVVGLDQTIANRVEISAEGYLKSLRSPLIQPPEGAPIAFDRGLAYGGELTMRYRLRQTFFLWAWFAYGRSQVFDGDDRFVTGADQPFSGGLVASWNILVPLNVALRYRIASGLPYTDVVDSLYEADTDTWRPRFGTLFGERLPLYQKIDLHVAYTFTFPRWSLSLSGDVWIVPPSSAQLYPVWSDDWRERRFVQGPPVLPLLGVRATF